MIGTMYPVWAPIRISLDVFEALKSSHVYNLAKVVTLMHLILSASLEKDCVMTYTPAYTVTTLENRDFDTPFHQDLRTAKARKSSSHNTHMWNP